jgi:2-polyprenyl-3-methyl-5-hydroxy-6-metoxy-1,4-benzoquinol methylase
MMLVVEKCPICASGLFHPLHRCKDTTVSHETFSIKVCQKCGLGITSPRPQVDQLKKYYQSEKYISHSGQSNNVLGKIYLLARKFTLSWKKNVVSRYSVKGNILDVGCGTGEFLSVMKQSGWKICGIEPSEIGRIKAEALTGITIHESLDNLTQSHFEAISLWHVLEHIPDIQRTIKNLQQLLTQSGKLFIAVPNYLSYDASHYKEHWAGFDVPRHLWHFSKQSMIMLLEENGLKVISIVPMKLDAYYVSILSERNKKDSALKSFINGIHFGAKSNRSDKRKTNHSSLLYIAQPA